MPEARSTGRSISNDVKTSARKATQPNFANLGSFLATEPKAASKASRAGEGHPVCGQLSIGSRRATTEEHLHLLQRDFSVLELSTGHVLGSCCLLH